MPSPYLSNYGVVEVTASALSLTAGGHAGQKIVSNLAGAQTFTLPAATGSGNVYEVFVQTTKTGDLVIQAASASDTMCGSAVLGLDGGDTVAFYAAGATADTITLDGSTTGGVSGAYVKLVDIASTLWHATVISDASGSEASPFSAEVG